MKSYIEFSITKSEFPNDILIAYLEDLPISSFWESDILHFYVEEDQVNDSFLQSLRSLSDKWHFTFESQQLPDINWNATWESKFEPVAVGRFCYLRATFHESGKGYKHEICIDPKMAFGTGHHATTYMMIQMMEDLDMQNASLWDFGCGTGILAILASKMGANDILANDIEDKAIENGLENAEINKIEGITFLEGGLDVVPQRQFDFILANINRNVLLDSMAEIKTRLKPGGVVLFSGILEEDKSTLSESILGAGIRIVKLTQKEDWLCFLCQAPDIN